VTDEPVIDSALVELPESGDLVRSARSMAVLTAVSRGTGFLRIAVVTNVLGTTYLANTYETANTVPNILFELLAAGALQAVLIPTMVELVDGDDRDDAEHVVGAVLGLTCALLAGVAVAVAVVAPQIMAVLFNGVTHAGIRQAEINLGSFFLWFFLPQVIFYVGNVVATALLNADGSFALPVFAPTINNVVVIGVYLAFAWMHRGHGVSLDLTLAQKLVLGGGTTVGVIAFCAVPIVSAGRRFRLRMNLDHRHPKVRRLAREGSWAALYLALAQVLLVVILQISNRREGAVAVYNLAYILFVLPHSLFSVPVLTTRFPTLTRQFRDGDIDGFADNLSQGMRSIGFLTLPATGLRPTERVRSPRPPPGSPLASWASAWSCT
jgi:putative peptidoglycan lipid II flippase